VGDQLTRARTGIRETEPVYEIVQPAFEQEHEVLARDALHLDGLVEQIAELLLVEAVHMTELLFLLQLDAVTADLPALGRAVLTRRERTFQFFARAAQRNAE